MMRFFRLQAAAAIAKAMWVLAGEAQDWSVARASEFDLVLVTYSNAYDGYWVQLVDRMGMV
jgi:hypothetical protein